MDELIASNQVIFTVLVTIY